MTTSHFSGPLADDLAQFLAALQARGNDSRRILSALRSLDRSTKEKPLSSGTIDETIAREWMAPSDSRGPNTLCARYHLLRRFCRYLATRRPGTFVPGEPLRPRRRQAPLPHIYSREELRLLLDGALALRDWEKWHHCPIRSKTIYTIILLLVTSGLRISEALHLALRDVDLDDGVLSIRQTKFRKSRLVPVSAGTLAALRRYHRIRLTVAPMDPAAAFFVSGRGTAYTIGGFRYAFYAITRRAGIRPAKGRGPRVHDLRATFAVARLQQWYREDANLMARLPLLSTYLGHARVSDTEVYLRTTPTLLDEASRRFYAFTKDLLPRGGRS